jgi:hypothetical protein
MRTATSLVTFLALALVLAACGGGSKPAPQEPTPATDDGASASLPGSDEPSADQEPPGDAHGTLDEPPPPEPEPEPDPPIYPRLVDPPGPIPGLEARVRVHEEDATYCGGVAVSITKVKKKKVAKADAAFAAVLDESFPANLDMSEPHRAASMKKFDAFLQKVTQLAETAQAAFRAELETKDAKRSVIAVARMAQLHHHVASLLARAPIPVDVRSGEGAADKSQAYCEQLALVAGPMLLQAEQAATACGDKVALGGPGWWTAVCTAPVTPAAAAP